MLGYEFTRWWAYRRIRHGGMRAYVWTAPLALTVIVSTFYFLLPVKPQLGGPDGALKGLAQILALLPGFFISALAAVATFNRAEMDETMPEPAPEAVIRHRGKPITIKLTRRMFLSYLFSYLSILSFILFLVTVIAPFVHQNIKGIINLDLNFISGSDVYFTLKYFFTVLIIYLFSSLLVSTLHGIYFLCERIHMPNS